MRTNAVSTKNRRCNFALKRQKNVNVSNRKYLFNTNLLRKAATY